MFWIVGLFRCTGGSFDREWFRVNGCTGRGGWPLDDDLVIGGFFKVVI